MNLEYLSDVELLENFIPKEAAQNILHEYNSLYNVVNCATGNFQCCHKTHGFINYCGA